MHAAAARLKLIGIIGGGARRSLARHLGIIGSAARASSASAAHHRRRKRLGVSRRRGISGGAA